MLKNSDSKSWQQELADSAISMEALIEMLNLDGSLIPAAGEAIQQFPLKVTASYLSRIKKGDINDPLLKQILPVIDENSLSATYSTDPVGDLIANKIPGLLHKYKGRVLLTLSGACAINCRFCFRRNFPYHENLIGQAQWQKIIEYIRADESIHEVIFSGGDPLVATDQRLEKMLAELTQLKHVQRIRFHTRLPVVLPSRITAQLLNSLTATSLKIIMVIHCNHPNEIDQSVEQALKKLAAKGIKLYNQSVLLKGVNDEVAILTKLQYLLYNLDVQPYYLHLLDKVQGTAHFDLPEDEVKKLYQNLAAELPGYLLPKLVREIIGESGKSLIEY